jgi:hypothetical protein
VNFTHAEDIWDGERIEEMLQSYYGKLQDDFSYESDITDISGSFTKEPTTEDTSNIIVSVDFSKSTEALPGDFVETNIGQSSIYRLSDGPNYINEDWMTYASRSYGYCGEYRVSVEAYVSLTKNLDSSSTYIDLMDKYSGEYFSAMLDSSQLCQGGQGYEINENIQVKILDIVGEVEIKSKDSEYYIVANIGDLLEVGDRISTGFESEAVIEVNRVATMTVREMTNFSVSQLFYDGDFARTAINLGMGSITTSVRPEKGVKASFEIVTPTSTIGVRGTEFSVSYDENGNYTYVYVFEGSVEVSDSAKSKTEVVGAGKYAYISSNGEITVGSMEEDYLLDEGDDWYYELLGSVIIIAIIVVAVVILIAVIIIVVVIVVKRGKKKGKEEKVDEKSEVKDGK